MKETPEQADWRRQISGDLTKKINSAQTYPDIRNAVIRALADIDAKLHALSEGVRTKYLLRQDMPLVHFYIKGGNAFAARMDMLQNHNEHLFTSGDSDWDTQIVIDPWLPGAVQNELHALIEDLVVEELTIAGQNVALLIDQLAAQNAAYLLQPLPRPPQPAASPLEPTPQPLPLPPGQPANVTWRATCDPTQALRRVYSRDTTGLTLDTRRDLTSPGRAAPPGIILNDAIRPFILYRMGYTWHAELITAPPNPPQTAPATPRPILMELIDVSLPRRNSIEAVTVWSEIDRGKLVIGTDGGAQDPVRLPLPDMDYHLRENLVMLCEIAVDPNRPSARKRHKRVARVNEIYTLYAGQDRLAQFKKVVDSMAGEEASANANASADQQINGLTAVVQRRMQDANASYVQNNPAPAVLQRIAQGRQRALTIFELLKQSFTAPVDPSAMFSDDLVLVQSLKQSPYLDVPQVPFTGVDVAFMVRVDQKTQMAFDKWDFARKLQAVLPKGTKVSVRSHAYNTRRGGSLSYEVTLVVLTTNAELKENKRALAFITLTSATEMEAPGRPSPNDPTVRYASLQDIDGQRKAAAALLHDFVLQQQLGKQHDAISELLTPT